MSNLFDTINSSSFDFYFLVVDEFLDIEIPQLSHFISLSPQKLKISLDQKNSGRLLSHPTTLEFIKNNSRKTGRQPAIVPFKPSAKIDLICHQNNWVLIGNPTSLNRLLEDKIKYSALCQKYQLPVIPFLILPFSSDSYQLAQQKFGPHLVLQTHFGWAGNSSFLSSSWDDVSLKISPGVMVKFSPHLLGYSLINNCCLTGRGLIQSPPGLQYTGLKPLTQNPLATVGRQWPSQAPQNILDQIQKITTDFSKLLNDLHYLGFFGLDFLVSDNQVYLIECNPRLTASFAFYTQIEINAGFTPLFLYHLAEFCHLQFENLQLSRFSDEKIIGSEITLKNSSGSTIKRYRDFIPFSPTASPVSIDPSILAHVL
jgi:hypothetical protein